MSGIQPAEIIFGAPTQLPSVMVDMPTPEDVARFLLWDPTEEAEHIKPHLYSVMSMVRGYTRGVGFSTTDATEVGITCTEDIAGVIVMATARSVSNPAQATRVEVGSYNAVPAKFEGFTLAEQFVLNQYRRRTA